MASQMNPRHPNESNPDLEPEPEAEPVFDKQKHIRYWLRMFKTLLPTHYESTDSNRMFLAFTILSSLDILGILHPSPSTTSPITPTERADAADWIYSLQHPAGGFRGFPGTKFSAEHGGAGEDGNGYLDPANAAGTSFALASLVVLRDDLARVDRVGCRRWLRRLQAEDGSFAEVLGKDGGPVGKRDVRHSYFAVATRYVLDVLDESDEGSRLRNNEGDFDVERLVGSILRTQNYDGGISGEPGTESHGGYAYCAVGCLALLGELQTDYIECLDRDNRTVEYIDRLISNLIYRQVPWIDEESYDEEDEDEQNETEDEDADHPSSDPAADGVAENEELEDDLVPDSRWFGFDGRCNKPADTCYSFWVGGTLAILGLSDTLLDPNPHRRFLLERTEHRIGGFGKTPGDPPDAMHSFMGLLALSFMHEPGLESIDPSMAITVAARKHLESLRSKRKATASNSCQKA